MTQKYRKFLIEAQLHQDDIAGSLPQYLVEDIKKAKDPDDMTYYMIFLGKGYIALDKEFVEFLLNNTDSFKEHEVD